MRLFYEKNQAPVPEFLWNSKGMEKGRSEKCFAWPIRPGGLIVAASLFNQREIDGAGVGHWPGDGGEIGNVLATGRVQGVRGRVCTVGIDGEKGCAVRGGGSRGARYHGDRRPPPWFDHQVFGLLITRIKGAPFIVAPREPTVTLLAG